MAIKAAQGKGEIDDKRFAVVKLTAPCPKCGKNRKVDHIAYPRVNVPWVYRSHARELCDRRKRGQSLNPPTSAELAVSFCGATLRTPLDAHASTAYERVFREAAALVDHKIDLPHKGVWRESWPHAADEVLTTLRARMTCERGT